MAVFGIRKTVTDVDDRAVLYPYEQPVIEKIRYGQRVTFSQSLAGWLLSFVILALAITVITKLF
jgi:hypothetical protein